MPKKIKYSGQIVEVIKSEKASRSNDPAVKEAYLTEKFGWVIDKDCEKVE